MPVWVHYLIRAELFQVTLASLNNGDIVVCGILVV